LRSIETTRRFSNLTTPRQAYLEQQGQELLRGGEAGSSSYWFGGSSVWRGLGTLEVRIGEPEDLTNLEGDTCYVHGFNTLLFKHKNVPSLTKRTKLKPSLELITAGPNYQYAYLAYSKTFGAWGSKSTPGKHLLTRFKSEFSKMLQMGDKYPQTLFIELIHNWSRCSLSVGRSLLSADYLKVNLVESRESAVMLSTEERTARTIEARSLQLGRLGKYLTDDTKCDYLRRELPRRFVGFNHTRLLGLSWGRQPEWALCSRLGLVEHADTQLVVYHASRISTVSYANCYDTVLIANTITTLV